MSDGVLLTPRNAEPSTAANRRTWRALSSHGPKILSKRQDRTEPSSQKNPSTSTKSTESDASGSRGDPRDPPAIFKSP